MGCGYRYRTESFIVGIKWSFLSGSKATKAHELCHFVIGVHSSVFGKRKASFLLLSLLLGFLLGSSSIFFCLDLCESLVKVEGLSR